MASQKPSDTAEIVDVLVIGAGPSGAVVTHTAAAAGLSVICLEQGDWVNPSDFPANFPEWELLIQHNWAHDPNVRGLPSDYPVDVEDSDMWPVMFNAVGGSSIYYGAEWPRLLPSDFRVKTLDGVADDWPISYNDLKPYHDEVDEFIGVAGVGGDTAYPEGLDYPLPPHPMGKAGIKAAQAANKLGWHWWPGTNAIAEPEVQNAGAVRPLGCVRVGLPAGRQGLLRPDLHASSTQGRCTGAHRCAGPQDPHRKRRTGHRRGVHRPRRQRCVPARPCGGVVRQRRWHPAALAALRKRSAPRWPGQLIGPRRPQPHAAPQLHGTGLLRRRPGKLARPRWSVDPLHAVLRDRQITRVRTRRQNARPSHTRTAERHRGSSRTRLRRTVGPGHPRRRALGAQRHLVGGQHRRPPRGTQPRHPVDQTCRPRRAPCPENRIPDQRQHPQDC